MKNVIAENIIDATISSSSESPDYLFTDALLDSSLARIGRTLLDTAQWIKFSFPSAVNVDVAAILGNNITDGATVKIQANSTDTWTSPAIDVALTYTKNNYKSTFYGRDVGDWSHQFDTTQTYQYWRVYIDDASNPDDYIEIGFIFIDEAYIFTGMSVNQVFRKTTTSNVEFSFSGQAYGERRLIINEASFSSPTVTETDKTTIDKFFYKTDIIVPFLMFVWENSLDVQRPLYVVNTSLPEWQRVEEVSGVTWRFNMSVREVF